MTRLIIAGLALSLIAGCGLRGNLERPPPMGQSDADRAAQEAEKQRGEPERRAEQTPGVGGAGTSIPIPNN